MKTLTLFALQLLIPFIAFSQNNGIPLVSLLSISPARAMPGQTLDVTLTADNIQFRQASSTTVKFGYDQSSGITVNSTKVISDTKIKVNITISSTTNLGDYDVSFNSGIYGSSIVMNGFKVSLTSTPPIIPGDLVSIKPAGARVGQTLNVTILGSGTHFITGENTYVEIYFKGVGTTMVTSTKPINDSTILAVIVLPSNVAVGKYSVIVSNSLDQLMATDFYVYENCFSHFTTTYNDSNSKFTLKLDSVTSTPGSTYAWDFGDGGTSTDETPVHVFATDAVYNVCLNVSLASGESCSYCHEIGKDANGKVVRNAGFTMETVRYDGTVSIAETSSAASIIAVYPNPANDLVTITVSNAEALHNATLSLLSIEGQLLIQQPLKQTKTELNIGSLAKGTYVIKLISNEKTEVIKLVKE